MTGRGQVVDGRRHGTRACYVGGCRREECVDAHRAYEREYRRRRRAGAWGGAEDRDVEKARVLEVVRRHTTWAAADWAGVSRSAVAEWARYGLGLRRGAGRPSREEIERAKPRPSCGCPMCAEWNDAQAAEAARLYGLGMSEAVVAERMGVSERTVDGWLDRAGVVRRAAVSFDAVVPPLPEGWEPPTAAQIAVHGVEDGWEADAECTGMHGLFYPARGVSTDLPVAVCASCPVALDCATHAIRLNEKHGIWGGLSERQRRRIRRQLRLGEAA